MSTMPIRAVDHTAPPATGLSAEIITVSALLTMPAVWTAVVERALPAQVLLERFLIVLLTCALLAELVRRLGEGGALSQALAEATPPPAKANAQAPARASRSNAPAPFEDDLGGAAGLDDLGGFDDLGDLDQTAPLAVDAGLDGGGFDAGLDGDFDAGLDAGLTELAPLDLDADPF